MKKLSFISLLLAVVCMTGCENKASDEDITRANNLIESAYKKRDYSQILQLADSLERTEVLIPTKAYYWMGYASDRMKKLRMAEFYWKASMDAAANSTSQESVDLYAKSASRLTNLLSVRGDYQGALDIAIPAAQRLEELQCDSISDYVNLLIYIGCCQAGLGYTSELTFDGFERAYKIHLENIERNHTDESYKDAIAGLINIAFACNHTKNYMAALNWIGHFGELLGEYEQRPSTDGDYVDKQVARFAIYKAIALEGLGRKEEAGKVYESFLESDYSQTPEGRINANDYLTAANRWEEAADNYRSLDAMLGQRKGSYSMDDIRDLVLKKYKANMLAGRRDSAIAVSLQISDALDKAFKQAKATDAEEQATIVKKVQEMTEQRTKDERMKTYGLLGILGLVILGFIAFLFLRRHSNLKLKAAYHSLEKDYEILEKETQEKERAATEHRITEGIQQRMIPMELPKFPGLGLYSSLRPSDGACGDLYDCLIRDEKLFFCIGNPVDKEAQTAVLANMAWALFRNISYHEDAPEVIVKYINSALTMSGEKQMGVSLFVGVLDLATWQLTYCNAAHETPLLLKDEVNHLDIDENVPVGTRPNWEFTAQEATMEKGSMLFLYTSGLAKAKNDHFKQYGNKMVNGAALQAMKMNAAPKAFVENIRGAIDKFIGDTPQVRDMTMLVIKRL